MVRERKKVRGVKIELRKRRKNFHGNGKALQRTTFGRPEREREREGERGGERERLSV